MLQTIIKDTFGLIVIAISCYVYYTAYNLSHVNLEYYISTGCVKAESLVPYLPDDFNLKVLLDRGDSPQNAAQYTFFVLFPVNLFALCLIYAFSRVTKNDQRLLNWFKVAVSILTILIVFGFETTIVIIIATALLITTGAILRPSCHLIYFMTCVLLYTSHTYLLEAFVFLLERQTIWTVKLVVILINYLIVRWHIMIYHLAKTQEIRKITFANYYTNAIQYMFLPYISINGTIVMFGDWLNQKKEREQKIVLPLGYRDFRTAEKSELIKKLLKYCVTFILWRFVLMQFSLSCLSNHFILRQRENSTKFYRVDYFNTNLTTDSLVYENDLEKNNHLMVLFGLVNRTASFYLAYYIIFGLLIWLNDCEDYLIYDQTELSPRIYPHPPKCLFALNSIGEIWRYFDVGMYNYLTECVYFYIAKLQNEKLGKEKHALMKPIISTLFVFLIVFFYHGNDSYTMKWVLINCFMVVMQRFTVQMSKFEPFRILGESICVLSFFQAVSCMIFWISSSFFVERSNIAYWHVAILLSSSSGLIFFLWVFSTKMFMKLDFDC